MKTVRVDLPVLAADDEEDYLDLVTRVPGVVAALVDEQASRLEVIVSSEASALLVRQHVHGVLLATAPIHA